MNKSNPLKIGIVGGGFTGTALLAVLCKLSSRPLNITIYDKSGEFGAGPAYSTPFIHHLLNVRAGDMSAYEDDPLHFVDWLLTKKEKLAALDSSKPYKDQFVPRLFYYQYLQDLLQDLKKLDKDFIHIQFKKVAVTDITVLNESITLFSDDGEQNQVDKVMLALGNNPPANFPFDIAPDMKRIENPWDYAAIKKIAKDESVFIVGTGLSMIDAVLTLKKEGHIGKIYSLSRHGLLPLPHSDLLHVEPLDKDEMKKAAKLGGSKLLATMRQRVNEHVEEGGDWRSVISGMRLYVAELWQSASHGEKRQFMRHIFPYWSIHRHRVHEGIAELLQEMMNDGQLQILAGRIIKAGHGEVLYAARHSHEKIALAVNWVINCMGPLQQMKAKHQPLIEKLLTSGYAVLDEMGFGFAVTTECALLDKNGKASSNLYSIGAPTRGCYFEVTAVPDIRKQVFLVGKRVLTVIPENT